MAKIVRYDPFQTLRRSIWSGFPVDDWFDDVHDEEMLRVDVYEKEDNVIVEADLPGIDPDKTDVRVTSESVTIKASKEEEVEEKNREYIRRERRVGSYARTINFPVQVVPDSAKAEFVDGTLKLTVKKETVTSPTSVKVEVKK